MDGALPKGFGRAFNREFSRNKLSFYEARNLALSRKKISAVNTEKPGAHALAMPGPEVQHYQAAVQLMQQGKYEKALAAFEKMLPTAPEVLQERCRMYMSACKRQIEQNQRNFTTAEEQCDYATSLVNSGYYEDAREQFFAILDAHPDADYAFYGLAVLEGITGNVEACMDNLNRAIELNPKNRLQARSDTDFQGVVDDPRFTELLYPEIS